MSKLKKTLFYILLVLSLFFISACEINNSEPKEETIKQNFLFTYSSIGNGTIRCEVPTGTMKVEDALVYVLSVPNADEELVKWTVNGVDYGNNSGLLVQIDKQIEVIAYFTTNVKEIDNGYNEDSIYANLPNTWYDVKISIATFSGSRKSYDMVQNEKGIWYFSLVDNKISKTSILEVYFSDSVNRTESYYFDTDYNFFNYSGLNRNGYLSGGFDNKKIDNLMKLSILEMNDVHGYIVQSSEGKSGFSNASYLIEQVRDEYEYDNTVLVANGDMFQGSAISNLSHGLSVVKCMNEMNFDFMGIGNHEFDWGIEKILAYFDGDTQNGEANFPLVNSNVSKANTKELIKDDNIVSTYMMEKNGVKIGVISMIDDLKTSILYSRTVNYDFLGVQLCKDQAIELKNQGADIIIANIHGGDSDDPCSFSMNQYLSKLQYNGEWLIDCIINGHTHTNQTGTFTRAGQDLQVVQGGSYSYYVGQIDLYIDLKTKSVTTSKAFTTNTYEADTNYTKSVEDIIDYEYEKVKDQIEEVYCVAGATVSSKSAYFDWASSVMIAATDSVCGICNTGGLRSTGNVKTGQPIGLENVYLINPFDNELIIVEMTGKTLYNFLSRKSTVFYGLKSGYSLDSFKNDSKKYKVAVIDYVYYWDDFPRGQNDTFTGLVYRDCMIADLRLRSTFNPYYDDTALIGKLLK